MSKAGWALGLGITAFLLGWIPLLGWACIILAIVFGILGMKESKATGQGSGMALAGLILGCISVLLVIPLTALLLFGMLTPELALPENCQVMGGFNCSDYEMRDGVIRVELVQHFGETINAEVTATSDSCPNMASASAQAWELQERRIFTFNCPENDDDMVRIDLEISFSDEDATFPGLATGRLLVHAQ